MGKEPQELVNKFWKKLGKQQPYYTEPEMVYPDPIFRIKTKDTFMFDDYFWEVFQKFPFKICHVTFLDKYLTGEDGCDEKVFDLRFSIFDFEKSPRKTSMVSLEDMFPNLNT